MNDHSLPKTITKGDSRRYHFVPFLPVIYSSDPPAEKKHTQHIIIAKETASTVCIFVFARYMKGLTRYREEIMIVIVGTSSGAEPGRYHSETASPELLMNDSGYSTFHQVFFMIDTGIDGHIHTRLCHHAQGEMEEYVQAAINRGLREMYFLEHLEVGIRYFETTWLTTDDFNYYFQEGNRLKEQYSEKIFIGLGVEVGYNPQRIGEIKQFLSGYRWDRIGISYHFLETGDRYHLNMVSSKQANMLAAGEYGPEKVIQAYYQGLLDAVQELSGTVLCHLDAALRHFPTVLPQHQHLALIEKILAAAGKKGMALEINTSGYKKRNTPYPAVEIIRMAIRQGMPLTAGSDSHRPNDIGRNFDRLQSLALELAGPNEHDAL
ncbi:histidinol-phosphatase [Thermodesulfobacteriota bacterium]